jgi:hypothetical protein
MVVSVAYYNVKRHSRHLIVQDVRMGWNEMVVMIQMHGIQELEANHNCS